MTVIEIDVIFDFVCAWCYIGKRRLDTAIALYQKTYPGGKSDTFIIRYRPYYLNYGPSTHSVDKAEVAEVKLGSMTAAQRAQLHQRMDQIGRAVGVVFRGGGKVGDTRAAHRLVRLAGTSSSSSSSSAAETQSALVEAIFAAYHEQERDIADRSVLREIAAAAGLGAAEVGTALDGESDELRASVVDAEAEANKREFGASGVPSYVVQGSHRIDGAQDAQDFMEAFIKVKEAQADV